MKNVDSTFCLKNILTFLKNISTFFYLIVMGEKVEK
jgi:hypothetical protein